MENAAPTPASEPVHTPPPPPPDPNTIAPDPTIDNPADTDKTDTPLHLTSEEWDITRISALSALHMLISALEALAEATGDIPPTPPVSRPSTPKTELATNPLLHRHITPPSPGLTIGSPEAHPTEPLPPPTQQALLSRRFFSKTAPPFSITTYLLRLHKYCPHSPAVYLAAATYIQRLCVDGVVPATHRTIHRLSLATIRVAAKALEDHKWSQERMCMVGGVGKQALMGLEVTVCFLLDFGLGVDAVGLARGMFLLQRAAGGAGVEGGGEELRLSLPVRGKARAEGIG